MKVFNRYKSFEPSYTVRWRPSVCLLGESAPGNATTAAQGKRADAISPAAGTDTRTITGNAAGSATAIARGTATETAKESGRGSTDTARREGRWVQNSSIAMSFCHNLSVFFIPYICLKVDWAAVVKAQPELHGERRERRCWVLKSPFWLLTFSLLRCISRLLFIWSNFIYRGCAKYHPNKFNKKYMFLNLFEIMRMWR